MKRWRLEIIVLICVFLVSGCGVRWQIKDTWFIVYEVSSQGAVLPLAGALVSVAGENYTGTRYTDSEGKAFFQIPPGTYSVQVGKSGYNTVTDTITIFTLELTSGRYVYELVPQGN